MIRGAWLFGILLLLAACAGVPREQFSRAQTVGLIVNPPEKARVFERRLLLPPNERKFPQQEFGVGESLRAATRQALQVKYSVTNIEFVPNKLDLSIGDKLFLNDGLTAKLLAPTIDRSNVAVDLYVYVYTYITPAPDVRSDEVVDGCGISHSAELLGQSSDVLAYCVVKVQVLDGKTRELLASDFITAPVDTGLGYSVDRAALNQKIEGFKWTSLDLTQEQKDLARKALAQMLMDKMPYGLQQMGLLPEQSP